MQITACPEKSVTPNQNQDDATLPLPLILITTTPSFSTFLLSNFFKKKKKTTSASIFCKSKSLIEGHYYDMLTASQDDLTSKTGKIIISRTQPQKHVLSNYRTNVNNCSNGAHAACCNVNNCSMVL